MKTSNVRILWLDCLGGLLVGALVLLLLRPLSSWEGLPISVVASMGLINLCYGGFSLYVTTRKFRPLRLVKTLAVANMSWLVVCGGIAFFFRQEISSLGMLHVVGEGIYVAALGVTEWRWRYQLSEPIP
ncbi:MAG: hypothetical protein ACSHYB_12425 [Roseibacillus sp.]